MDSRRSFTRIQLNWLITGLLLVIAPHALRMPFWVSGIFLLLLCWRLLADQRHWPLPAHGQRRLQAVKHGLAIGIFAGIYVTFQGHIGRDAGLALLIVLMGLKLLELKTPRDYYVTVFLGYFLVITNFFFSQGIDTALLMLLVVIVMTASLISLNDRSEQLDTVSRLRLASRIVLQSLPLMLIAFLLFPRIQGPLWGLPADAYGNLSGLSETMSPGKISHLSLSDAVAFRVRFDGKRPGKRELYWRGPVLWHSDGRNWSSGEGGQLPPTPLFVYGQPYTYTVTLEPHNKRWLFALEMPGSAQAPAHLSGDFQLLSDRPVRERKRYRLQSFTHFRSSKLSARARQLALQLPPGFHTRSIRLARGWRRQLREPDRIIRQAMNYFRDQPFYYTLTPPPLAGDSVDEFLFGTRRGFCEHYAAAFTVLMRAAGIPARVVTGYQGGEYNALGDYLLVRQRDAHAWSEVWLDGRGWVRMDPTAAVSPARIEQGSEILAGEPVEIPLGLNRNATLQRIWRDLGDLVDAVNNGWNQWVLGYGPQRQRDLLQSLGMHRPDWQSMALWLLAGMTLILSAAAAWLLARHQGRQDPARRLYERFCRKLARQGIKRRPSEGPLDFARRAGLHRQGATDSIERITSLYIACRYAGRGDLALLARTVRNFQP